MDLSIEGWEKVVLIWCLGVHLEMYWKGKMALWKLRQFLGSISDNILKANARGANSGKSLLLLLTNKENHVRLYWLWNFRIRRKVAKLCCRVRTCDFRRVDRDLYRELIGRTPERLPREKKCRGKPVDLKIKLRRFCNQLCCYARRPGSLAEIWPCLP